MQKNIIYFICLKYLTFYRSARVFLFIINKKIVLLQSNYQSINYQSIWYIIQNLDWSIPMTYSKKQLKANMLFLLSILITLSKCRQSLLLVSKQNRLLSFRFRVEHANMPIKLCFVSWRRVLWNMQKSWVVTFRLFCTSIMAIASNFAKTVSTQVSLRL